MKVWGELEKARKEIGQKREKGKKKTGTGVENGKFHRL